MKTPELKTSVTGNPEKGLIKEPEKVVQIGIPEDNRRIYIEDYVLQYLRTFKEDKKGEIVLFGSRQTCGETEIYIISGACEYDDFSAQEGIGCINMEIWKKSSDECSGIIVGDAKGGQAVKGYYVFYNADERMVEYLAGLSGTKSSDEKTETSVEKKKVVSPFIFIRMTVMFIFIVLCVIAVTTINSHEKMRGFVDAMVQMNEIIEADK